MDGKRGRGIENVALGGFLTNCCVESSMRTAYECNRFVELMPITLLHLCLYLHTRQGAVSGVSFIDSTPLPVCHNRRIERHQTFAGLAARGKTSMGWFYGFKLHLVVNDQGELLAYYLSAGNVDDRQPVLKLARGLKGTGFIASYHLTSN